MTDRLYYDDPHKIEFDATIIRVESRDHHQAVWLNRSAFYPTSGGQPFDTGMLASHRVVDVADDDAGDVVHIVEADAPLVAGQAISGTIDWARRFDHMQQHTGQHVLSAAIVQLFNVPTVSFHLGGERVTIDVARELTPAELTAAEHEANSVVWDDRPVTVRYVSAEEAAQLPLRKEPARAGRLRLVDVEHFDLSACGGTHVRRTGAIGVIAVSGWERFKGGQRIEFLCGGRAVAWFRQMRDSTVHAVRLLSVLPGEIPASIERMQDDAKAQKRRIVALESDLARFRASELAANAEAFAGVNLVLRSVDGDANALKELASSITTRPGYLAILLSSSAPALVVAARSSDVEASCQAIVSGLARRFGGRGGGKPDLAQGGGLQGATEDLLRAARELIGTV